MVPNSALHCFGRQKLTLDAGQKPHLTRLGDLVLTFPVRWSESRPAGANAGNPTRHWPEFYGPPPTDRLTVRLTIRATVTCDQHYGIGLKRKRLAVEKAIRLRQCVSVKSISFGRRSTERDHRCYRLPRETEWEYSGLRKRNRLHDTCWNVFQWCLETLHAFRLVMEIERQEREFASVVRRIEFMPRCKTNAASSPHCRSYLASTVRGLFVCRL